MAVRVVWHGTAAIELACPEGRILFDPFVPLDGSEVAVDVRDFDGFDHVFVTHGHFDHIASIPEVCRRNPQTLVHCTWTPYRTLQGHGVSKAGLSLLEYGQTIRVPGFEVRVHHGKHAVLPKARRSLPRLAHMVHSAQRANLPRVIRLNRACPENDECVFYEVLVEGRTICLMGSLNLRESVAYPTKADLLVLPYNGWSDNLPPAVRVIERLRPRHVVLDHYDDSFPPVTMPLDLAPLLERYPGVVEPLRLGDAVEVFARDTRG